MSFSHLVYQLPEIFHSDTHRKTTQKNETVTSISQIFGVSVEELGIVSFFKPFI